VVIASQVLHLLDNPKKAVNELLRITKNKIILPLCLTKNMTGFAKFQVKLWNLLGANFKESYDEKEYLEFLTDSGLKISSKVVIDGAMPMIVVVCEER
jgi:hypothetical protein